MKFSGSAKIKITEAPDLSETKEYVPSTPAMLTILGRRFGHSASLQYNKMFGVNVVDWGILKVLNQKSDVPAREFSEILYFDKALISRRINFLNEVGYVKTRTCKGNKAKSQSSLTAKGRKLYDKIADQAEMRARVNFRNLTETEKKTLNKLLAKLLKDAP